MQYSVLGFSQWMYLGIHFWSAQRTYFLYFWGVAKYPSVLMNDRTAAHKRYCIQVSYPAGPSKTIMCFLVWNTSPTPKSVPYLILKGIAASYNTGGNQLRDKLELNTLLCGQFKRFLRGNLYQCPLNYFIVLTYQ